MQEILQQESGNFTALLTLGLIWQQECSKTASEKTLLSKARLNHVTGQGKK